MFEGIITNTDSILLKSPGVLDGGTYHANDSTMTLIWGS